MFAPRAAQKFLYQPTETFLGHCGAAAYARREVGKCCIADRRNVSDARLCTTAVNGKEAVIGRDAPGCPLSGAKQTFRTRLAEVCF